MRYEIPDLTILAKYMHLLRTVLVRARARAYSTDAQLADLLDAVENLPDLLMRWPDMKEDILRQDLARIERLYPEWTSVFTGILSEGAPENWQLKNVKSER